MMQRERTQLQKEASNIYLSLLHITKFHYLLNMLAKRFIFFSLYRFHVIKNYISIKQRGIVIIVFNLSMVDFGSLSQNTSALITFTLYNVAIKILIASV